MTAPTIHDYASAAAYLGPKEDRPLENNTRLVRRGTNIAVRLWATDVVTYHPDGSVTLDSGGWLTVTTKARINAYLPFSGKPFGINVWSDRGRWFVNRYDPDAGEWVRFAGHPGWDYRTGLHTRIGWYFDGIHIAADGTITNPVSDKAAKTLPRAERRTRNWSGAYYGMQRDERGRYVSR